MKEIKDLMGEDYKTTLKHTADPNLSINIPYASSFLKTYMWITKY